MHKCPNTDQEVPVFLHDGWGHLLPTSSPSGHTQIPVQDRLHHQTMSDSDPAPDRVPVGHEQVRFSAHYPAPQYAAGYARWAPPQ